MGLERKRFWHEEELYDKLCKRRKGQHLTNKYRIYIRHLLKEFPENYHSIKAAFKLSTGTFCKLKKMKNSTFDTEEWIVQKRHGKSFSSTGAQKFIAKTLCPPQFSMTIKKIRKTVYDELGETYSSYIVKNFVKNALKFNFKKGCSRPPKYIQPKTVITKGLFWTELLRMIHKQQQLIFNVDEWSFTRAVKAEYSWLPVGKSSMVINDHWKGSASLIMALGSNGQWFWIIWQGTINSEVFWIFLNLLKRV